jgi:WD40 repeat protein
VKAALLAALVLADIGAPEPAFDPARAGLLRSIAPLGGELFGVAYSRDGRRLALGCGTSVRVYDTLTWAEVARFDDAQSVYSVAFSPDGRLVAAGGFEGAVQFWNLSTSAPVRRLAGHRSYVSALAWSPDGRSFLSGSHDGTLRLWEPEGERSRELKSRQGALASAAFSADGRRAVTTGEDGSVLVWNAETWEPERKLQGDRGEALEARFVPGGRLAALSTASATVWDAASGERLQRRPLGFAGGAAAAIFPDGRWAVVSDDGFALRLVDLARGGATTALKHHLGPPSGLAVHPAGRGFVSIGKDRLLKVWGARSGGMAGVKAYGFCGIQVQQTAVPGEVVIAAVNPGTPASEAGLRPGDLLSGIGGRKVATPTDVVDLIRSYQEGDEAEFVVVRPEGERSYRIRLARKPAEQP